MTGNLRVFVHEQISAQLLVSRESSQQLTLPGVTLPAR